MGNAKKYIPNGFFSSGRDSIKISKKKTRTRTQEIINSTVMLNIDQVIKTKVPMLKKYTAFLSKDPKKL